MYVHSNSTALTVYTACPRLQPTQITCGKHRHSSKSYLPHQFLAILYMLAALTYMSQASSVLEELLYNKDNFIYTRDPLL